LQADKKFRKRKTLQIKRKSAVETKKTIQRENLKLPPLRDPEILRLNQSRFKKSSLNRRKRWLRLFKPVL
jgi:hypothetical protein